MADEFGEKTEEPTDRRIKQAREQGNVARSTDLNAAILMLASAVVLHALGISIIKLCAQVMYLGLKEPLVYQLEEKFMNQYLTELGQSSGWILASVFLIMVLSAITANLVQVGFLLTTDSLEPKLSNLNPIDGLKRIFSIQSLIKLFASLGKLILLVSISVWFIYGKIPWFMHMFENSPSQIISAIYHSVVELAYYLSISLILLALLDFWFQRWKYSQDLRMSKQEIREEMKDMEGNPEVRQRRKEAHRKLAQARELQQVADADVIITNPTFIAIAIKYDPTVMDAPKVVAKGKEEIARSIRRIAVEAGVPIIERKALAWALYKEVKVGQMIPIEMYEVFVEIMAYVYKITGRKPPNLN